jgi:hypothetical protein
MTRTDDQEQNVVALSCHKPKNEVVFIGVLFLKQKKSIILAFLPVSSHKFALFHPVRRT